MTKESPSPSPPLSIIRQDAAAAGTLHFHFIGICGTAMGAVAAALQQQGHQVSGSDGAVYPPMSDFLASRGIRPASGYRAANLPPDADVFVIGNAISRGNPELEEVLARRLPYLSLPEVLRHTILRGRRNFVVTGTHGKTTTTSMLAWILEQAGLNPGWLIGGLPRNLGQGARFTDSDFVVLEGDEYDTAFFDKRSKFVHYLPELVIINNIEFDHADIFADLAAVQRSFGQLVQVVPANGLLVVNGDDPACLEVTATAPAPVLTVGLGPANDRVIRHVSYHPQQSRFELTGPEFQLELEIPMDGEFNVRNAAMAAVAALHAGVDPAAICAALAGFQGVARRQEVRGQRGGVTVIDDFGHHPSAIRQAIGGMRQRYPGCRIWAVFEPRSNTTRRKVVQQPLTEALALADMALISAVDQPEKVPPGQLLDPHQVVTDIRSAGGWAAFGATVDDLLREIQTGAHAGDVVVVFSNGSFQGIHERILNLF